VWKDFNLCKTYRGLVSERNLRHSSRRIEKGTANPRRLHVLPPSNTESPTFREQRFSEKLGAKNPQTILFGKFGTALPKTRPSNFEAIF
jgi:hypothetical protein